MPGVEVAEPRTAARPRWRQDDDEGVPGSGHAHVRQAAPFGLRCGGSPCALLRRQDVVQDGNAPGVPAEDVRVEADGPPIERIVQVEVVRAGFDANVPDPGPPHVVKVRRDHNRPLQTLCAVVGQHVHGIAAGDHRLQIQLRGRRILEPEQEPGERRRLVLRCAMVLVLDREMEKGIQVALALGGGDGVRPPGGHDRADADVVEHPRQDLHRRLRHRLAAQVGDAGHDGIVGHRPVPFPFPGCQPAQPVRKPLFRLLAGAQGPDFCRGKGVGGIVQPAQARPCKAHFRRFQEPGQGNLHGHPTQAQCSGNFLDVAVGRGEHRDVAVGDGPHFARLRVAHPMPGADEFRDGERQCAGLYLTFPLRERPAHHRRRPVDFGALRR